MEESRVSYLPARDYYPLDIAAQLLNCELRDIYHSAARGHLVISILFPTTADLEIRLCGDIFSLPDFPEVPPCDSFEDSELSIPIFKIGSFSTLYDVSPDNSYENTLSCVAGGLWDLSTGVAEVLECVGKIPIPSLGVFYPAGFTMLDDQVWGELVSSEKNRSFTAHSLFITSERLNELLGKKNVEKDVTPSIGSKGKGSRPGRAEGHAIKRESVLKAALNMKYHHPELCENYTKWAEAITDHAHRFWDDGCCPLSIKEISALLGRAHKTTFEH